MRGVKDLPNRAFTHIVHLYIAIMVIPVDTKENLLIQCYLDATKFIYPVSIYTFKVYFNIRST